MVLVGMHQVQLDIVQAEVLEEDPVEVPKVDLVVVHMVNLEEDPEEVLVERVADFL